MRFLCDVHIPIRMVKWLISHGHEAQHVNRLPQSYHTADAEICRYADTHGFIVVTKDADFRDTHLILATPRRLIRILLGNLSNDELLDRFGQALPIIESRFAGEGGYIEIHRDRTVVFGEDQPNRVG